ncbi:portal protein [Desulfovibrio ferrophilus]|uniref:Head-tail connector protein n=1 Tax=Desulfovibrio ferrophilus TaxID=241368 RepID=A0A2Z6AZZ0_9BACT|nr:portal protein [Desulfovibrio ferrophilus]BBD08755.1 head-tail connector protein [Desulfovibrio ferrophilus]
MTAHAEMTEMSLPLGPGDIADEVIRRHESLLRGREAFDPIWEEVAQYMGPAYSGFTARPGHPRKQREDLVDSTARRAANVFAAGMLSGVSSPSQRWFRLGMQDRGLAEAPGARAWLQEVEDIAYRVLSHCGFYPQQTLGYHQAGLFGWQCLYVDEDPGQPGTGVRFRALPLHEVCIAENFHGEVDTVFRSFRLTARQATQKWGEANLSDALRRALHRRGNSDEEFDFLHAVYPRRDSGSPGDTDRGKSAESVAGKSLGTQGGETLRPYVSVYLERVSRRIVATGGYAELPYIVTRSHRLPGTPYSYSPGTEALADAKMINEMKRLILEAGQLAVAPPYLVPDDGFVGRFSFEPRAMNYYRRGDGNSLADFGPLSIGGDPRFSWELLSATKEDINEAFFVDLFLAIKSRISQGGAPTAMEVAELAGERMFLLGPMLVNQQQENFRRLFDRLFRLLDRRGELPPPPPDLAGRSLDVDYVSPLMLAQQETRTNAVLRTYAEVGGIASVSPQVLDLFDHDENVRLVLEQRGFPQTGVRSRSDVAALRELREQAAAGEKLGEVLEDLAQTAGQAMGSAPVPGSANSVTRGDGTQQEAVAAPKVGGPEPTESNGNTERR